MARSEGAGLHERFGGQCQPGDIAPYVLVPGSKSRVRRMAELWDESRQIAEHYEFLIYTGSVGGVPISACSTGIGGASVAIAALELIALGARALVRVGVTGSLQPDVQVGDLVITSGAVRHDRISEFYLPQEIPALASYEIVLALSAACQRQSFHFHVGISATAGSFYCGEGRPGYDGYTQSWMPAIPEDYRRSGVLDWDTETATLLAICMAHQVQAGRINGVLENPATGEVDPSAEDRAVVAAIDAIQILDAWDKTKIRSGEPMLLPKASLADE